jgi:hypothetical protein
MLGIMAGGAVAGTAGLLYPATAASAHGDIQSYPGIWSQRTVYEISGDLTDFGYRPSFHDRMSDWMEFWYLNTPPASSSRSGSGPTACTTTAG